MIVKTKLRNALALLLIVASLLPFASFGPAQPAPEGPSSPAMGRLFRIAYVRGDPEALLTDDVYDRLAVFLENVPSVRAAMMQAGIDHIAVQSADSHDSLCFSMDQDEFDLVFCSAVDYVWQRGHYQPAFQFRPRHGSFDPSGTQLSVISGVIFVHNRSELFREADPLSTTTLTRFVTQHRIAMVGSYSAAGNIAPYVRLSEETSPTRLLPIIPCHSSEEVVKYVINGIAEMGACEKGVLEQVLQQNGLSGMKQNLVRVLFDTELVPTDPVVFLDDWHPSKSRLGSEIASALREFFARERTGLPRLSRSRASNYDRFRDIMRQYQELQGWRRPERPVLESSPLPE